LLGIARRVKEWGVACWIIIWTQVYDLTCSWEWQREKEREREREREREWEWETEKRRRQSLSIASYCVLWCGEV